MQRISRATSAGTGSPVRSTSHPRLSVACPYGCRDLGIGAEARPFAMECPGARSFCPLRRGWLAGKLGSTRGDECGGSAAGNSHGFTLTVKPWLSPTVPPNSSPRVPPHSIALATDPSVAVASRKDHAPSAPPRGIPAGRPARVVAGRMIARWGRQSVARITPSRESAIAAAMKGTRQIAVSAASIRPI